MKKLNQVVAVGLVRGDVRVMAAGPLTKQPGTSAYRIVLACTGDQFVVWTEYFPHLTGSKDLSLDAVDVSSYVESGDYFKLNELAAATERFAERVKAHAGYIESVYRDAAAEIDEDSRLVV